MAGISLITKGFISPQGGEIVINVRPTLPINVTILKPTQLDLAVETKKLDVVVKD